MRPEIKKGTIKDISAVLSLNEKWYRPNLKNLDNGYLSVLYNSEMLNRIVEAGELFVLFNRGEIVGYCLVNTKNKTDRLAEIQELYYSKLPERIGLKIAFSWMILMDDKIQGKANFKFVLDNILPQLKSQYEFIVSTVSKFNPKSVTAHKSYGWSFRIEANDFFVIEI